MRDHGNLLAAVACGQRRDAADRAPVERQQRLAALRAEAGIALAPAPRLLGKALLDLGKSEAFEAAEATLAQTGLGAQMQARTAGHHARSLAGAGQIAGVDRVQALAGQGLRQPLRLPAAGLVQFDVELALDAGGHVPRGLAVANGDDARRLVGGTHPSNRRFSV